MICNILQQKGMKILNLNTNYMFSSCRSLRPFKVNHENGEFPVHRPSSNPNPMFEFSVFYTSTLVDCDDLSPSLFPQHDVYLLLQPVFVVGNVGADVLLKH